MNTFIYFFYLNSSKSLTQKKFAFQCKIFFFSFYFFFSSQQFIHTESQWTKLTRNVKIFRFSLIVADEEGVIVWRMKTVTKLKYRILFSWFMKHRLKIRCDFSIQCAKVTVIFHFLSFASIVRSYFYFCFFLSFILFHFIFYISLSLFHWLSQRERFHFIFLSFYKFFFLHSIVSKILC